MDYPPYDNINLIYINHMQRKSLCFLTFLSTDFILQTEFKCGTIQVQVILTKYIILCFCHPTGTERQLGVFSFSQFMCYFQRTSLAYTRKLPREYD